MPIAQTFLDFSTQVVSATGAVDATVTVPKSGPPGDLANTPRDHMSLWMLCVNETPVYMNAGAAATAANVVIPVGVWGPFEFPPGTVLHALATGGAGSFGIVRSRLT